MAAAGFLQGATPSATARSAPSDSATAAASCNFLATRVPDLLASVPVLRRARRPPRTCRRSRRQLLIQYAETDERINAGWPAYEAALKAAGVTYTMHMYPGTQHGFNNDTTPRYDKAAAAEAWKRTIDFFAATLRK